VFRWLGKTVKMNEWKYEQEIFVSLTQGRGMVLFSHVVQNIVYRNRWKEV
jgi:hypothetical protein